MRLLSASAVAVALGLAGGAPLLASADLLSTTPTLAPLPSLLPGSSPTASTPVPVVGPTSLGLPIPPVLPPVTAPSPLCSVTNSCPTSPPINDPGTNTSPRTGSGGTNATPSTGVPTPGAAGTVPGASSPSGGLPSALDRVATLAAAGLDIATPPPVVQLSPLAGISFGRAPYLWPMFLLLDLVAAGAVVLVVRRTWSTTGAD